MGLLLFYGMFWPDIAILIGPRNTGKPKCRQRLIFNPCATISISGRVSWRLATLVHDSDAKPSPTRP
jgi:hypothetical protein